MENIQMHEDRLKYMQSVNDYYTQNGTTVGHPEVDNEIAKVLDGRAKNGQKTPYSGQFFTENRKEVERLKATIDRLQLMFNEKPSDDRIATLKQNRFKWAPKGKAWQRPLTN